MNSFWIILIEVNLILSIIYLGYRVLLKNLTFFRWARFYLLGGMLTGLIYPLLKARNVIQPPAEGIHIALPDLTRISANQSIPWERWGIYLFLATLLVLFLRFAFRFFSLGKIHADSSESEFNGHIFQNTRRQVPPFSFWKWIYIHRKAHSDTEMRQIIAHENIHTRERHTVDVMIAEICSLICWYNPLVKRLNRSVKDNLEFLVDHEVLSSGVDRVSYQHSLVGVSLNSFPGNHPGNQFAFKTLKKRIKMMNSRQSSKYRLASYLLLTPVVLGFAGFLTFSCQQENIDTTAKKEEPLQVRTGSTARIKADSLSKKQAINIRSREEVAGRPTLKVKNAAGIRIVEGKPLTEALNPENIRIEGRANMPLIQAEGREISAHNSTHLNPSFVIRGAQTQMSEVLIILDGKEISQLNTISPNDIESIRVLKDQSAIEKYGEKAKKGVVEIQSKKSPR